MDHANGAAMVSGDRPMMIRVGDRKTTEEREPGCQCYCRKFHDLSFMLSTQRQMGLPFNGPIKIFFKRDRGSEGIFAA
jgi:hypothetical protein